jgi:hypothetical protein
LVSGTTDCSISANSYNSTVTDNSGNGSNQIDIASVVYTPAWTGSVSDPVIGDGTLRGEYSRQGDVLVGIIEIIIGAGTTMGSGTWRFGLPLTVGLVSGCAQGGAAYMLDAGTKVEDAIQVIVNSTNYITLAIPGGLDLVTPTTPWTWAVGDIIRIPFRVIR